MSKMQKWGGIAALYEGIAYIIGILFFIFIVDYSGISDPIAKVAFIADGQSLMYLLNIVIYVIFGVFMVVLSLALYEKFKSDSPSLMQIATAFGLIWATVVIASGMTFNIGMETVIDLYAKDPVQAGTVWLAIEAVVDGIGGGNEIIGGIWIFLISIAALRVNKLPNVLNIVGIIVGVAGILSTVPPLGEIGGMIFGMVQIIWFIWLGILMLCRN